MKFLACFVALLLMPAAASAQVGTTSPYSFTVPLRLENVPEATSARIACAVSRLGAGVTGAFSAENEVARGETTVTISGGRYSGDVVVPTTWRRAGAAGTSYQCSYTLMGPSASGGAFAAGSAAMYTRVTGRTITSAVGFAEGPIG